MNLKAENFILKSKFFVKSMFSTIMGFGSVPSLYEISDFNLFSKTDKAQIIFI